MLIDRRAALALGALALLAARASAADAAPSPSPAPPPPPPPTPPPPPLSARYAVTLVSSGKPARTQRLQWTFHRSAEQLALLKGAIDEIWSRDAQGRISFQRVFHEHGKVTDYSSGELATLGIAVDWLALSTLLAPGEREALRATASSGKGVAQRVRLQGQSGSDSLRVEWLPALQLPALIVRTSRSGASSRIELRTHAAVAPADWPQAGLRSASYLHLDAADFGDMDYEPVVRLSEALDVRRGWRKPHAHD